MKHNLQITAIILIIFLATQFIGLKIVSSYIEEKTEIIEGKEIINKTYTELPYNLERPELEQKTSFIPFIIMIIIVTCFALFIIKHNIQWLWKAWFFIAVLFGLTVAFSAFLKQSLALALALVFSYLKLFKRNIFTQNISELFIYGGIAAVFAPIMSIFSISMLLIIISIYDFIAVYKTKHMIKLAKSQAKMKTFPGLMIPYDKNKMAILGGGDLGIPLLFTAIVFHAHGSIALAIPLFTTIALSHLMLSGEKSKFYPAMPILSLGCFIGYGAILLSSII
jgi:presenilin-like A22 family membrane protease